MSILPHVYLEHMDKPTMPPIVASGICGHENLGSLLACEGMQFVSVNLQKHRVLSQPSEKKMKPVASYVFSFVWLAALCLCGVCEAFNVI